MTEVPSDRRPNPARTVVGVRPMPFLRWAGGKRWLAPILAPVATSSQRYFEPFLGGGAVFLASDPVHAYLADSNARLIEAYTAVRDHPHEVLAKVRSWTNTADSYYRVRAASYSDMIARSAQFIFLNRTCWNGLYRVNKNGDFNVPYGNNPERQLVDEQNFHLVSQALQGHTFVTADFAESLYGAGAGDFVYLDPPYATRHSNGFLRYTPDQFSWHDQERLASVVRDLVDRGCQVAISNADSTPTRELFRFLSYHRLDRSSLIAGSAKHRRPVVEALFATDAVTALLRKNCDDIEF